MSSKHHLIWHFNVFFDKGQSSDYFICLINEKLLNKFGIKFAFIIT